MSNPPTLIQIVPMRSTVPDGIGDYASRIADTIYAKAGVRSVFVLSRASHNAELRNDRWSDICLPDHRASTLFETLGALSKASKLVGVLVHISLYGYQKRGLPFWLATGLKRWKATFREVPLIGLFHELWVAEIKAPFRSSFWVGPFQRRIICRLFRASDLTITTTERFETRLRQAFSGEQVPITVRNVFSNIGEPASITPVVDRLRRLVVFGGDGITRLVQTHSAQIATLLDTLEIKEIVDIGTRKTPPISSVKHAQVQCMGVVPSSEISRILATSRYGLLPYGNRSVLGKSTILAAYAAHGVVPIAMSPFGDNSDGLVSGYHYIASDHLADARQMLPNFQERLIEWYRGHTLARQADDLLLDLERASNRARNEPGTFPAA